MTTIAAGQQQTITIQEGQALNIVGTADAAGMAYLLDPSLGGTNSSQSWPVGAGVLPQIGPYVGQRQVLVTCSAGSISAEVRDAVLGLSTPSGGMWKASGALPDGGPVVIALAGLAAASSVYEVRLAPTSGDTLLAESGTSAAGPWTPMPQGGVTLPDSSIIWPDAATPATHVRVTRSAGSGTTSRYYINEISN